MVRKKATNAGEAKYAGGNHICKITNEEWEKEGKS
jgi:hypothetical protein